MNDNLIPCPHCSANLCYETHHSNFIQWMCFNCGYGSNSYMVNDSDFVKSSKEVLPELIKELEFIDQDSFIWYPSTINIPEQGILFANGSGKDAWGWTVAPLIPVLKEEKKRFPKGQTHKVDISKMEHFLKENFALAVSKLNSLK